MSNSRNTSGLELLDKEIHRLRLHSKQLEKEIDKRFDYFQDNYSSIMIKSLIPVIGQRFGIAGSLLQLVFQNQRLQDSAGRLTEQLFDRLSGAIEFIVNLLDGKKKQKE